MYTPFDHSTDDVTPIDCPEKFSNVILLIEVVSCSGGG
jgi:hypothetical protein